MTADSSAATVTHSAEPGGIGGKGGTGGNGVDTSPARKAFPSPWSQVVRGGIDPDSNSNSNSPSPSLGFAEQDPVFSDPASVADATAVGVTPPEGDGDGGNCNAGGGVKSPWNKPSVNGAVEVISSPVMNAASWPALSESTKPGVKSLSDSSVSSSKSTPDGSAVASQAPLISQPPLKHVKPNSNSQSNPNYVRQRSVKRGGSGGGGGASTGYARPPPLPSVPPVPPPFPVFPVHSMVPQPPQPPFKPNTWSPRPVDHSLNRHPNRRNSFNPRPVNNGHGGRREHQHHGPRPHVPHQMSPPPLPSYPGFIRPVFLPFRPYAAPMVYDTGASYAYFPMPPAPAQVPFRGVAPVAPHGASASSMRVTSMDSSLRDEIRKQIEYYFSDDNLAKDHYLRSHMDDEGWVPITLIAGFPRVQDMTKDIQMLSSSLKDSNTVEIQGGKIRKRADWRRWTRTPRQVTENTAVEASLQQLTLENVPANEEDRALANGDGSN